MNDEDTKKIEFALILEILGRPKEHITTSLKEIIKKLGEEKGVRVTDSRVHEPKNVEGKEDLFTTFAEVEIEVESLEMVVGVMFKYMPAHVEIISPEKLRLSNHLLSDFMSEITRRLHKYDEVARILQNEKAILERKLKEALGEKEK